MKLLILWLLLADLPAAHRIEGIPLVAQGQAPFCAAAAALMGASRGEAPPPLLEFVRTLPVAADGIPFLEICDALTPRGIEARVVLLTVTELKAALAADIPVILAVRQGPGRHAVLAVGYDEGGILVHDPALPTPVPWSYQALVRQWAGRQAIVLLPAGAELGALPVDQWRSHDARYRALEWALRAERLPAPGPDMLALYDRAVAAAPAIAPIRYNRARVLLALAREAEGCGELRAAAALDPTWPLPGEVADQRGCPPDAAPQPVDLPAESEEVAGPPAEAPAPLLVEAPVSEAPAPVEAPASAEAQASAEAPRRSSPRRPRASVHRP
ncbi:MAG: papain-like cysteine protease family protein [bacterium]